MSQEKLPGYWQENQALIRYLLMVWMGVVCGSILLANPLNQLSIGKVPLGFWLAQSGAIYIFVSLIFIYTRQMDKLDRKYHKDE